MSAQSGEPLKQTDDTSSNSSNSSSESTISIISVQESGREDTPSPRLSKTQSQKRFLCEEPSQTQVQPIKQAPRGSIIMLPRTDAGQQRQLMLMERTRSSHLQESAPGAAAGASSPVSAGQQQLANQASFKQPYRHRHSFQSQHLFHRRYSQRKSTVLPPAGSRGSPVQQRGSPIGEASLVFASSSSAAAAVASVASPNRARQPALRSLSSSLQQQSVAQSASSTCSSYLEQSPYLLQTASGQQKPTTCSSNILMAHHHHQSFSSRRLAANAHSLRLQLVATSWLASPPPPASSPSLPVR